MTMSSLPLYDTLLSKKLKEDDLTTRERNYVLRTIPILDLETRELFHMLIKEHEKRTSPFDYDAVVDPSIVTNIPYEGIQLESGIQYDFDKFPIKLKRILHQFVKMSMQEKKRREKQEAHKALL